MKIYEPERTDQIVARLVKIGNTLRPIVILSWVILVGILFSLFGSLILERNLWWLGGILGILLGYSLGVYFSSLLNVVFEWMAQVLIAQGEIIAHREELP